MVVAGQLAEMAERMLGAPLPNGIRAGTAARQDGTVLVIRSRDALSQIWGRVRRGVARHTKSRDQDAISHHYDLGNAFYRLVLDPSMAYSCAYFTSSSDDLAQAQDYRCCNTCRAAATHPAVVRSSSRMWRRTCTCGRSAPRRAFRRPTGDPRRAREHYVWTVRAWAQTLEDRWALVGEGQARVWRLYLAGGALTFEEGRMGVDQILAVRRSETGRSGMPRVRRELVAR